MNKTFIALVLSASIVACTSPAEKNTEIDHANHQQEEAETLQLNGNEKWQVNEEMKPFIVAAEQLLNDFIESKNSDYSSLAAALQSENEKLMRSCTMDGESHDQLHLWLYPNMKLIKSLGEAQDQSAAEPIVEELRASYELYHQYFE